jgi:hypothetical protein
MDRPYFNPSAASNHHQPELFFSPLLIAIDGKKEDLLRAAVEEYNLRPHLTFAALWKRCEQLPPKEKLDLCLRFFTPLSSVANQRGDGKTISHAITQSVAAFGPSVLDQCANCAEIERTAVQIHILLNCCSDMEEARLSLRTLGRETDAKNLIQEIAQASESSQLHFYVIGYVAAHHRLDPLQSLALSKEYVQHWCAQQPTDSELAGIEKRVAILAAKFGQQGIVNCVTIKEFDTLAVALRGLLDLCPSSGPLANDLLLGMHSDHHASILKSIFNSGRNAAFFQFLICHVDNHSFKSKDWIYLETLMKGFREDSIQLWLTIGIKAQQMPIVKKAALNIYTHLSNAQQKSTPHGLDPLSVEQLIHKLNSCDPEDSRLLRQLWETTLRQNSTPPPLSSALLQLLCQDGPTTSAQYYQAACEEIQMCRTYFSNLQYPFPALLEKCSALTTDQGVHLCLRFFSALKPLIQEGSLEHEAASFSVSALALHMGERGLNIEMGCLEIRDIAYQMQSILNLFGDRSKIIEELSIRDQNPLDQLLLGIAKAKPEARLHTHIVACVRNLRGLSPMQTLRLAQDYLQVLQFENAPIDRNFLPIVAADFSVRFGYEAVEACQTLVQLEEVTRDIHQLLDHSELSRNCALSLLEYFLFNPSNATQVLSAIFKGERSVLWLWAEFSQ